jgi:hypothetical protein
MPRTFTPHLLRGTIAALAATMLIGTAAIAQDVADVPRN